MTAEINLNIEFDHPAVGAYTVYSKQLGYLPIEAVNAAFDSEGSSSPKSPGVSVHIKRALEDVARNLGDKHTSYRVETKGRASCAVHSIISVDKDRIDISLDDQQGRGVANAIVSAKIVVKDDGNLAVQITPSDSPYIDAIVSRYEYHKQHYKCAEDLSTYLSQKFFRGCLGAVPRAGAGGTFYVPRGEAMDRLIRVRDLLHGISKFDSQGRLLEGVKIYVVPVITTFGDAVDAITDSVLDEAEKFCYFLEDILTENNTGEKNLGPKALTSKMKEAHNFRDKLAQFKSITGSALDDVTDRMKALETRLLMASIAAAGDD